MKMDFFSDLFYLYTCILTHMYVYHMHAWYLQRPEEGVGALELDYKVL